MERQAKTLETAVESSMQMGDIDSEVSRILKDLAKEPDSDKSKEIKKALEGVMQKRALAPKTSKTIKTNRREVHETRKGTEAGTTRTTNINATLNTTIEGNENTTSSHSQKDVNNLIKQIQSEIK
jgi:hypothetical protein